MKPPKALRIGGQRWTVKMKPPVSMKGVAGRCYYSEALLTVATGQTPFDTRDTLLHEAMHAVLAAQGRSTYGNEEEELYVRALATGLMGILQDNPEFAQWLIEPLSKPNT